MSKSSAAVSRARPKIADYPFTTLHPNLGVAHSGDREFVLADIPGLIEGAHDGAGLGDRFLGHVERCRALVHLVDGTAEDVVADYRTVRRELEAYDAGLPAKPELVCLNKCDALAAELAAERAAELQAAAATPVRLISGVAGSGLPALLTELAALIAEDEAAERADTGEEAEAGSGAGSGAEAAGGGWRP